MWPASSFVASPWSPSPVTWPDSAADATEAADAVARGSRGRGGSTLRIAASKRVRAWATSGCSPASRSSDACVCTLTGRGCSAGVATTGSAAASIITIACRTRRPASDSSAREIAAEISGRRRKAPAAVACAGSVTSSWSSRHAAPIASAAQSPASPSSVAEAAFQAAEASAGSSGVGVMAAGGGGATADGAGSTPRSVRSVVFF